MKLQKMAGSKTSTWMQDALTLAERESNKKKVDIAVAIFNKRKEKKMNQKEFAKFLGCTQGMVSKLESGECNLTIEKMDELFDKLDMRVSFNIRSKYNEMYFRAPLWKVETGGGIYVGGMIG